MCCSYIGKTRSPLIDIFEEIVWLIDWMILFVVLTLPKRFATTSVIIIKVVMFYYVVNEVEKCLLRNSQNM